MGPQVGCIPPEGPERPEIVSRGAVVTDNILRGEHMGYGYVVAGVVDWTVTGNVDDSTHEPVVREQSCFERPVAPPSGFQLVENISEGTFQDEFENAVLGYGGELWPIQTTVSAGCVEDVIWSEQFTAMRDGLTSPIWDAMESAASTGSIDRCIDEYEQPDIGDAAGDVMVGLLQCEPTCVTLRLTNLDESQSVNMESAKFFLEDFPVTCDGLPSTIGPREEVLCTIHDFVAPGPNLVRWYGYPQETRGWIFDYPIVH